VDHFVLAKLETRGLSPSPAADKYTLLRRATYDLIACRPRRQKERFLADPAPDAFAKVVTLAGLAALRRALGRHWLDVAAMPTPRTACLCTRRPRAPVRLYLSRLFIRAFNEDLPFDRFIHEQLAPTGSSRKSNLGGWRPWAS